jgi:hypothetical protein
MRPTLRDATGERGDKKAQRHGEGDLSQRRGVGSERRGAGNDPEQKNERESEDVAEHVSRPTRATYRRTGSAVRQSAAD